METTGIMEYYQDLLLNLHVKHALLLVIIAHGVSEIILEFVMIVKMGSSIILCPEIVSISASLLRFTQYKLYYLDLIMLLNLLVFQPVLQDLPLILNSDVNHVTLQTAHNAL
jgi:hypothetical protein